MALFKKKKEAKALPELQPLPELPVFPELPKEEAEAKGPLLPAFAALPPLPKLPEIPQEQPFLKPMTIEVTEMPEEKISKKEEPIFVKLDRYRDSIANLEMIKRKLAETSNLLEKIKETRAKEEEELELWTQEISAIKEKIAVIDKKLFSV